MVELLPIQADTEVVGQRYKIDHMLYSVKRLFWPLRQITAPFSVDKPFEEHIVAWFVNFPFVLCIVVFQNSDRGYFQVFIWVCGFHVLEQVRAIIKPPRAHFIEKHFSIANCF